MSLIESPLSLATPGSSQSLLAAAAAAGDIAGFAGDTAGFAGDATGLNPDSRSVTVEAGDELALRGRAPCPNPNPAPVTCSAGTSVRRGKRTGMLHRKAL